jgi:radical SAM superfamily enzyme YgiQ (UPF0313 family)
MKVALVQPKIPDGNYMPSLGLLYIASLLESNGFCVKVFDENYDENVIKGLLGYDPAVIGITSVTAAINSSIKITQNIKRDSPARVVFGGAHPTAVPGDTVRAEGVDFVVINEGEYPMLELCKAIREKRNENAFKDIPNLYYKIDGSVRNTKKAKFLSGTELDELPYPAFHLLDLEYVFKRAVHGLFSMGRRILPIMTSRGCPQVCTFCCRMMGYRERERSVSNVIKEIRFMKEAYNIDELYIEDDNFTGNRERAVKILDEIIKADLGIYIKFANGLRADTVDEEILSKIKEAGGYWVGFGIESGSKRVLGLMKKNLDLELAKENVRTAKRKGLFVGSNFIIGYPEETEEDLNESMNYFKGLGLDSCAVVNLVPFPGTAVCAYSKKMGYLTKDAENYDNYYFKMLNPNILVSTPALPQKKAKKAIRAFFLRFYLRPDRLLRVVQMFIRRYGHQIFNVR